MPTLDRITDKIQVILGTNPSTQADINFAWVDVDASVSPAVYNRGRSSLFSTGTTPVDVVPVPPSATIQRKIETASIVNRDAGSIQCGVWFNDNGTNRVLWQGIIPTGGTLMYSPESQWQVTPLVAIVPTVEYGLWKNKVAAWMTTTATAGLWIGTVGAGAGTYTTALPTTTNVYTAMKRARWANVVTTLNQVLGQRNTEAMFFRGNSDGQGGFYFFACFGFDVWTNGGRMFAGFHTATTVVSADPSALANTIGFSVDAAENGQIQFMSRDGSAVTKVSTGMTIVSNRGYCVEMYAPPAASYVYWKITDMVNGTTASGTATVNLPVNTTLLTAGVLASNAALTPVTSIQLGVNRIYVEV